MPLGGAAADAGIVDQDMDLAIAVDRGLRRGLELVLERDVGEHTVDVGVGALELLERRRERRFLDVAQHDLHPGLGEGGGDSQSNA
jgi:hypothetical protein